MMTTASRDGATLAVHQHGKARVRIGRTWRIGDVHYFVEWKVRVSLISAMEKAFTEGDNTGMTPTDTCKNTCYFIAKQCKERTSPEMYAIRLASHFVETYPLVSVAKVWVEEMPWRRISIAGKAHDHGFVMGGSEVHTVFVTVDSNRKTEVESGIRDWKVLKTTQSGYEGYLKDKFTSLTETNDRIVATSVTSTWKYSAPVRDYSEAFEAIKAAMADAFYGPAKGGIYSPSVQYTLFEMARMAISSHMAGLAIDGPRSALDLAFHPFRIPELASVFLSMPNLHFLPSSPPGCESGTCQFEDDVYIATSEPHGSIEACVTRTGLSPHRSKL